LPELPEVESFGNYLEKTSLNKEIKDVEIESPQLLQNINIHVFKGKLESQCFLNAKRHGKYLFVRLNNNLWLVLHFGMTGSLKFFNDNDKKPPYGRIIFNFVDGSHLAFIDPRKFGKINLIHKIEDFIKNKELGPDALDINLATFKKLYSRRRGASKSALMNQHVMSGVGNIYSDEILYHACVHPKTSFQTLSDGKLNEIFKIMKEVLKMAVARDLNSEKLPDLYLIPNRIKNGECPGSKTKLKTIKISGRTSYYCPDCQKEIF
jgi:formamidopyrimidine-DNA glycosylase